MSNRLHREMEAALMERMLPFAEDVFGDEAINEALLLFLDDDDAGEFDLDDPLNTIFIPWFLFTWRIENEDEKPTPEAPMMKTVAEAFLDAKRSELTPDMVALIEAAIRRPFSFYQVLETVSGKTLKLEDLLLGHTIDVVEDAASTSLRQGEIVMGSLLRPMNGVVRPLTLSPFALEKGEKITIQELKEEVSANAAASELSEEILLQQEAFVIGLYLDIVDEMLDEEDAEQPTPPKRR
ncbi:MAG: hypothetical protein EOP10_19450 [Proteobacteria bacterium]|nr:MAG: hypothetical protein EOP10_19450 [Pseudomonadota bacterium]